MSKLMSNGKKNTFNSLMMQFKQRDQHLYLVNATIYLGIKQFCIYAVNYTTIQQLEDVDHDTIKGFLQFALENQKRVNMSLSDLKKVIRAIQELTQSYSCELPAT